MAGTSPAMTMEGHRAVSQVVPSLEFFQHDAHFGEFVADAIGFLESRFRSFPYGYP